MRLQINKEVLSSFEPSKIFRNQIDQSQITSLDYDNSGQFLISAGNNEAIDLYDCVKGKHLKNIVSKKYGCHLARFTHDSEKCLYVTTKVGEEHSIRYLSLNNNQYIRYFRGHQGLVNSMEISPTDDDVFLTSSWDNSVRVWDLRSSNCQGFMNCKSPSFVSIDPSGLVFAIGNSSTKEIGLYDIRNYDQEPFLTNVNWNKLEFSNDGKYIIIGTSNDDSHYVIDSYEGDLVGKLQGFKTIPPRNYPDTGSVSLLADGRYAIGGSGSREMMIWDLQELGAGGDSGMGSDSELKAEKVGIPRMTLFNPKFMMFATADIDVTMWLPDIDDTQNIK
ncbi:WD-repeat containing protein SWD2 [Ascoidea rubescens DSM 1968]|uniref:Subunit of the compass complex, which methylates histone H3 on lys 4 n=1 Tax=Ascoidea rubescens DSM 1968 TaxID=1344418 RepID=A0A1D2V9R8_9ASCO|nr:subunit of the compass complex, which methylates histone H3 on lys 4 [Ascoidea rubescens DSM 1968]ODV58319.1 subunit of the compass complex, which methylates histone H3 on lys 4 [Ascoidea rubescens DSM 1968]